MSSAFSCRIVFRPIERWKIRPRVCHTKLLNGNASSLAHTTRHGARGRPCSQLLPILLLLDHLRVSALFPFLVEILHLSKAPPLSNEALYRWWILAATIPATRSVAYLIFRVGNPFPAFLRNIEYLEKPHALTSIIIFRRPCKLEEIRIRLRRWDIFISVHVQVVHQRLLHHWRWPMVLAIDECVLAAARVLIATMIWVNRIPNASEMRRNPEIIVNCTCHDQHVVRQVPNHFVRGFLRARKEPSQCCNMFMVPCVAIGKRCAPAYARDLVSVVPPCKYARVLRGFLVEPSVTLQGVVYDHHATITRPRLFHDSWAGHLLRHGVRILHEPDG
mmetsp:Transcript_85631/g.223488  ORF Transcript_85631/g.223488 Transcript_85631/m.223488 type:complete len:332 (-) Transcript_85631:908-1903(-)